jgi:hypothetical protein
VSSAPDAACPRGAQRRLAALDRCRQGFVALARAGETGRPTVHAADISRACADFYQDG